MQGIGHLKQGFKEGSDVILHVFGDNHSAGFKEATAVGAAGAAGGEGEMHRFGVRALYTTLSWDGGWGTRDEPPEQLCLPRGWRSGESGALRAIIFCPNYLYLF